MSDETPAPDATDEQPTAAADTEAPVTPADDMPEEWKPEPREWTWKDVFTAPMLAFKPKCMIIAVITMVLMGVFTWAWNWVEGKTDTIVLLGPMLYWLGWAVKATIFGIGATLVSVFFKADLLDDEFLSLSEAISRFKDRLIPAIMVPVFLVGVVAGFNFLLYLGSLVFSLPFAGSLLYALLYVLYFIGGLVTVLLAIGAFLSIFVGPAVVAVRKHGWFDNVIDTFEAVGTKPQVLVGSLALTFAMLWVAHTIGHTAMNHVASFGASPNVPGHEQNRAELRGSQMAAWVQNWVDPVAGGHSPAGQLVSQVPVFEFRHLNETGRAVAGSMMADAASDAEAGRERLTELREEIDKKLDALGETNGELARAIGNELRAMMNVERAKAELRELRNVDEIPDGQEEAYDNAVEAAVKAVADAKKDLEAKEEANEASAKTAEATGIRNSIIDLAEEAIDIEYAETGIGAMTNGWTNWFTGLILGLFKSLIVILISGYVVNIFLAGGMLTYLAVRENDYWDDEDLEDLDKLAKELEEEAKQDAAANEKAAEAASDDKAEKADKSDDAPAEEEAKSDDDAPAEEEAKGDDDAPAEEEAKSDDDAPAEEEAKGDDDAPAEEEAKGDDDADNADEDTKDGDKPA